MTVLCHRPAAAGASASPSTIQFRAAHTEDGAALWTLVRQTGTLELNSAYFYVLFATDFGANCLLAERDGECVGAVVGYRPPQHPDTAFVWQVGVLPSLHGQGLGLRMLQAWRRLPAHRGCQWVTATVADDNAASQALFHRFAQAEGTSCGVEPWFKPEHFPHDHPAEPLYRVGPLPGGTLLPA
jgi:L-2,4-diaminobutyric acid acetyltransferase